MGTRLDLQALLENVLGSRNVYFQPPANISMSYPCLVYSRDDEDVKYADSKKYLRYKKYTLTLIHKVDSDLFDKVDLLPLVSFDRSFTANNLNHDVFSMYF